MQESDTSEQPCLKLNKRNKKKYLNTYYVLNACANQRSNLQTNVLLISPRFTIIKLRFIMQFKKLRNNNSACEYDTAIVGGEKRLID